jgi:tetratricopeptide (TPR) repeat protein
MKIDVCVLKPDTSMPLVCCRTEVQGLNQAGDTIDLPAFVLKIGFVWAKEQGEWRAQSSIDSDRYITDELRMAVSEKARQNMLTQVKPLIDEDTILTVRSLALQAIRDSKFADGHRLADITLEVARFVGNKGQEADAHVAHGIAYLQDKKYPLAMNSFWDAIVVFNEAHDRRAVGRALINYGTAAQDAGDVTLALEVFQSAIAILHQTRDEMEPLAWRALAGAWAKTENRSNALRAYQTYYRHLNKKAADASTVLDALAHISIEAVLAKQREEAIWAIKQMKLLAARLDDKPLRKEIEDFIAEQRAKINQ